MDYICILLLVIQERLTCYICTAEEWVEEGIISCKVETYENNL
jgi:hypothetical protein